jgi:hypothetical protein
MFTCVLIETCRAFAAAHKLVELANAVEPVQDGRIP